MLPTDMMQQGTCMLPTANPSQGLDEIVNLDEDLHGIITQEEVVAEKDIEQDMDIDDSSVKTKVMKLRPRSDRILKRKLAMRVKVKDGMGCSAEKPVEL